MHRFITVSLLLVSFFSTAVFSQSISTAVYLEKSPVIDGKMAAGEWSQSSVITGFVNSFTDSGRFTDEQMTAYLAYDKTHFYLGFAIPLGKEQLQTPKAAKRDGRVWADDCVEIFFQPAVKTKPEQIFHFIGNSKGVIYDEKNGEKSWDGKWNYSVSVEDKTWFGELAIPFSEFGAAFPENNSAWGMNINCDLMSLKTGRHWARVGESITNWEKFGKVVFSTEAPAVQLLGLGKLEQGKLNLSADICTKLNSSADELQAALLIDGKVQKSWSLKTKKGGKEKISFEKTIAGKRDRLLEFRVSSSDKKVLHKSSVPFLIRNRMNVISSYYSLYKKLEVRIDVSGFAGTKEGLKAVVSAVEAGSKKIIQEKEIDSFEKTKAMATLDVSSFKEGKYEINTSLQQNGKVLEESKEKFIYMNAVIPGKTVLSATQLSLAIDWFIEGDDNENCRVSVAYRKKGKVSWKTALDLLRIENMVNDGRGTDDPAIKEGTRNRRYWTFNPPVMFGNRLSGSIFYLKPDTTYDILLKLVDPDGGTAQRVLTARTRKIPKASTVGKTLHVAPGAAAGDGTAAKPFGSPKEAEQVAVPGDIIILHAGEYGQLSVSKDGEPERPVVWRGIDRDKVVLKKIRADGRKYLFFENLTVKSKKMGMHANSGVGIVVRGCLFESKLHCLNAGGSVSPPRDYDIVDNVFFGPLKWSDPKGPVGKAEGIMINGSGHVIARNFLAGFCDAMTVGGKATKNVDVFRNDIWVTTDDGIECDYAYSNIRVYENRLTNTYDSFSNQPLFGGPCYWIRNVIVNAGKKAIKFHCGPSGIYLMHNSIITSTLSWTDGDFRNVITRNNLFTGDVGPAPNWNVLHGMNGINNDFDYDGIQRNFKRLIEFYTQNRQGKPGKVNYNSLKEFYEDTGMEEHGIEFGLDIFSKMKKLPEKDKAHLPGVLDISLAESGAPVDAGAVLPSIHDSFTGKAPDLGAYEVGKPVPHYGPSPEIFKINFKDYIK